MNRRLWMGSVVLTVAAASAASPNFANRYKGLGLVIAYGRAEGSADKNNIHAETPGGREVFTAAGVSKQGLGQSIHQAGIGGIPEQVRVTWRKGDVLYDPGTRQGSPWKGGELAGDYTIPVLSRIPKEVFDYALAGPGRALRLIFRIKDDGVLLAWDVQEAISLPQFSTGGAWVYAMHGGDLPCEVPRHGTPNCTEGPLESAWWFNPSWVRGR